MGRPKKNELVVESSIKPNTILYQHLDDGDFFLFDDVLYMKFDYNSNQFALCIGNVESDTLEDMCGEAVIPVDVTMNWTPTIR